MILPMRPLFLFPASRSPARRLTYWYRPHTSRTRRPVVFIHGIGIGLYPYVNFLAELDSHLNGGKNSKDQVGIIAVEIMPVSFRITHSALAKDDMCEEIQAILTHHRFEKPVLVSHSYGTVVTTQLLRSPELAHQIGPIVLIDPISIMLHLPDVAYNFTRRKPRRANEHQLYYFASMDMGVSHSLSRCFFWSENVLWKHDIGDRLLTVSLAERDLIVDTKAVGSYLARYNEEVAVHEKQCANNASDGDIRCAVVSENGPGSYTPGRGSNGPPTDNQVRGRYSRTSDGGFGGADVSVGWKSQRWVGKGLDLIWFPTLDHAQVFDTAQTRKPLVSAVNEYTNRPY
jgi:pimeloyl-ACP methyl ester carboxylesterase